MPKKPKKRVRSKPGIGFEFNDPRDLERLKEIANADQRSVAYLIRRAIKWWLASPDAETFAKPRIQLPSMAMVTTEPKTEKK